MKVTRDPEGVTYLGYDDPAPELQVLRSPEPKPEPPRETP